MKKERPIGESNNWLKFHGFRMERKDKKKTKLIVPFHRRNRKLLRKFENKNMKITRIGNKGFIIEFKNTECCDVWIANGGGKDE